MYACLVVVVGLMVMIRRRSCWIVTWGPPATSIKLYTDWDLKVLSSWVGPALKLHQQSCHPPIVNSIIITVHSFTKNEVIKNIKTSIERQVTYGSRRLRLRPLHPFVGLEATSAISTATTAQHTTLNNEVIIWIRKTCQKKNTAEFYDQYESM